MRLGARPVQNAVAGADHVRAPVLPAEGRARQHVDELLLVAVLHFIVDDEEAERIVRTLRDRLAPGSHLAISHATIGDLDEEQEREGRAIYARSSTRGAIFRSHERVLRFFDGFELVEPGLVWLDDWRPEEGVPRIPRFPGLGGYAGVGILR